MVGSIIVKYVQLELTERTVEGSTFNEESILFPVKKLNNSSHLVVLAHQQLVRPLSCPGDMRKVVTA